MYNKQNKFKNNNTYQNSSEFDSEIPVHKRNKSVHDLSYFDEEYDEDDEGFEESEDLDNNESENYQNQLNNGQNVSSNKQQKIAPKKFLPKKGLSKKSPGLLNRGLNKISGLTKKGAQKTAKVAKKSVKAAKKTVKASRSIFSFFTKYKILILFGGFLIFFFLLILFVSFDLFVSAANSSSSSGGYYASECDFNTATVDYTSGDVSYVGLSLDEFVIGATYAKIKDGDYSDETIKTLLVILKTNILSYGNYSGSTKNLNLNGIDMEYIASDKIDSESYKHISKIYESVYEEVYLSTSHSGSNISLSNTDVLLLDENTLSKIEELQSSMNYEEILNELYSTSESPKYLYKLCDNCTYYTLTENDAWWWPIGSSEPDSNNIYGGNPTSTKINSYFGWRNLEGAADNHGAIDIAGVSNVEVVIASKSGTVTKVHTGCDNNGYVGNECGNRFGNNVRIDHGDGMLVIYAHLYPNSITVKEGDKVVQGQKIGMVGNSGSSNGSHLHFEMQLNGLKVDPLNYVNPDTPRTKSQFSVPTTSDDVLSAAETKVAVCKSLLASGYSENAVAGMMVNIAEEGSWLTNNLEGCYEKDECCYHVRASGYGYCMHPEIGEFGSDAAYTKGVDSGAYPKDKFVYDEAGYGLIQWTYWSRKQGLYDFAKKQNKSIANLGMQLSYLIEEVKGYDTTYKYITGNYSAYDISNIFCYEFEKPSSKDIECPNRATAHAENMLTFVKNGCS